MAIDYAGTGNVISVNRMDGRPVIVDLCSALHNASVSYTALGISSASIGQAFVDLAKSALKSSNAAKFFQKRARYLHPARARKVRRS